MEQAKDRDCKNMKKKAFFPSLWSDHRATEKIACVDQKSVDGR